MMGRVWPGATRGVDFKGVDIRTKKRKIQIGVCRDDIDDTGALRSGLAMRRER